MTDQRVKDLADLWRVTTAARRLSTDRVVREHREVFEELEEFADEELGRVLRASFRVGRQVPGQPSPKEWLELMRQESVLELIRASAVAATRERARALVEARAARAQGLRLPFPDDVVASALEVLHERVGDAEATEHLFKRRRPRWRVAPSGQLAGAPVVDVDDVELAVVAILAATLDHWQFSSTPDGRMFAGFLNGYHREGERDYVAGLSDVLDTVAGVIESHRAGAGGRVYVTRSRVECAECRRVIAWLGSAGDQQRSAFGRCGGAQGGHTGR